MQGVLGNMYGREYVMEPSSTVYLGRPNWQFYACYRINNLTLIHLSGHIYIELLIDSV